MRTVVFPELAAELARRGMKQPELAHAVDIAPGTVSAIIYGRTHPSDALRARIATVLDRDVAELFALNDDVRRLIDAAVAAGFVGDGVRRRGAAPRRRTHRGRPCPCRRVTRNAGRLPHRPADPRTASTPIKTRVRVQRAGLPIRVPWRQPRLLPHRRHGCPGYGSTGRCSIRSGRPAGFVAAFVERTRRGEGGLAESAAVVELQAEIDVAVDAIATYLLEHDEESYKRIGIALGDHAAGREEALPGCQLPTGRWAEVVAAMSGRRPNIEQRCASDGAACLEVLARLAAGHRVKYVEHCPEHGGQTDRPGGRIAKVPSGEPAAGER